ncbi:secreted RxLR effector protein 161-like [Aristolochia californica]|uniref:secreted RxLR effector protein 161-like n=1 Tax=Aristolochia californica TaxID=171875 RepID=UPI0035DC6329
MDVKTAFLNENLDEKIYMEQPRGFVRSGTESKVCKLDKSIYGLKQASRLWNIKFNKAITTYSKIFAKIEFVSREVYRHSSRSVSQSNSIQGKVPYDSTKTMSHMDCPSRLKDKLDESKYPYASTVGSFMYALICTRLELAYAVGILSRFQANPSFTDWEGVKWVMCYLKRTKSYALTYQADKLKLVGYSDFDYQGCVDTRKSTSGFIFMFGRGVISWKSKKEDCVAQSTIEAKYVAMNLATREVVYLHKFL